MTIYIDDILYNNCYNINIWGKTTHNWWG